MTGYGAACGAAQATVDALEAYDGDEDITAILERNMPVANTWGRLAVFDAIRRRTPTWSTTTTSAPQCAGRRTPSASARKSWPPSSAVRGRAALKRRRIDLVFGSEIPYTD